MGVGCWWGVLVGVVFLFVLGGCGVGLGWVWVLVWVWFWVWVGVVLFAVPVVGVVAARAARRHPAVSARASPASAVTSRRPTGVATTRTGTATCSTVATTATTLPDQTVRLHGPRGEIAVWRLADDPWLPGLAFALDPAEVRTLLQSLDVPPGPVHLRLRAYRAGRRAVVEVVTGPYRFFIKVLPPRLIARLQHRHRALEPLLPVPRSHGWSEEAGLVVLQAMEGATLRECLDQGIEPPPDPADLAAQLDRLPAIDDGARTRGRLDAGLGHLDLISRLAPDAYDTIEALRSAFESAQETERRAPLPLVPIHGDFHEAQLLVQGGEVSALLDIDTVTLGNRVDDWSLLIAHLDLHAAEATGDVAERARAYRDRVQGLAVTQTDHQALRVRIAASVFGQATGPFRVQSPAWPQETAARLERAREWLDGDVL